LDGRLRLMPRMMTMRAVFNREGNSETGEGPVAVIA
jgi:hypothetical protein